MNFQNTTAEKKSLFTHYKKMLALDKQ